MIARLILTLASLCCAARFCAGDADDVAMNQQLKQCAAAIKNDLQAAIANDKICTEILKECRVVSSTSAVTLDRLRCGHAVSQGTEPGSELTAKLTCPGEHGAATATSSELKQRLCFAAQLSTNTRNIGKPAPLQMLTSNTPSNEFVEGLITAANVDEVSPDVSRLATFLGQTETRARRLCKKYVVACDTSPAADQLKSKIQGDGCHWHTEKEVERSGGHWSGNSVLKDVKHTESVGLDLLDLAIQFKVRNPTNRLAKIMSSIDALHCGNDDKTMVGKKSFEDYATALNKVAAKMNGSP